MPTIADLQDAILTRAEKQVGKGVKDFREGQEAATFETTDDLLRALHRTGFDFTANQPGASTCQAVSFF